MLDFFVKTERSSITESGEKNMLKSGALIKPEVRGVGSDFGGVFHHTSLQSKERLAQCYQIQNQHNDDNNR